MAPFQYPTYENRLAGSIGDILARRGEIAAAAAQRAGVILSNSTRATGDINARAASEIGAATARGQEQIGAATARGQEQAGAALARGQEQSGAMWGQAVGGAVDAVGKIPQQAATLQAQDVQRQSAQLDLEGKQRAVADLKALDAAYQSNDGSRESIIQSLPWHLRGKVAADFANFDKLHAEASELQSKADAAKVSAFASAGMAIRSHGYDPTAAQLTISDLKKKYANDPSALSQVTQFEQALHADPTAETVKRMIDPILQADPKTREDLAKEAADKETARNHDLEHSDRMATSTETAARDAATKANNEKQREQEAERLRIEKINAGVATAREQREHDVYVQTYGDGSKNPDGTPKAPPISATARAIAEYRLAPLTGRAMTSGAGKSIMEQVMAANPDYKAELFSQRAPMRKAFTSGNQSQQLTALNTAIEHLGVLDEMAKALDNGSFQPGNELYNKVKTMFGDSAPTNFTFARDVMSGELATAMKKSGATDTEIEKVTGSLSSAGSPKQIADAIQKVALPMIGGKASTLDQQYHAVMGEKDPFSVYTPGAKATLERFNAAPKGATAAAGAPVVGGGKGGGPGIAAPAAVRDGYVRVVGPNGETGQMPKGSALPAGWKVVQ